mgnify:CR=1 FL=1
MHIKNSLKELIRIELLLSILFFFTPILLFVFQDGTLSSISDFAYSDTKYIYLVLINLCGILYMIDGIIYKYRRYNILLGICLSCVTIFPSIEYRWIHNTVAIIFFLGNSFVVTYHSNEVSKQMKLSLLSVIIITLGLFYCNVINLFFTESVGLLIVAFFMLLRFLRIIRIN